MFQFKRGASFDFVGEVIFAEDGVVLADMSGWSGSGTIRFRTGGEVSLTIVWTDPVLGKVRVFFGGDTSSWPVSKADVDLRFVNVAGDVVFTKTATFEIVPAITRP